MFPQWISALGLALCPSVALGQSTELLSVDSAGNEVKDQVNYPLPSTDGRYVLFYTPASLTPVDQGNVDVYVRDRRLGTTEIVSVSSAGLPGSGNSWNWSITPDGRWVGFYGDAPDLVANDNNRYWDAFVHDRWTGLTEIVSVTPTGNSGNSNSSCPSLSNDGRYVVFSSFADDLVPGDSNRSWDVFVRDRSTGITTRVSVDSSGTESLGPSYGAGISADGKIVVFRSSAPDLVPGDDNGTSDIFAHDLSTGITSVVSFGPTGHVGNDSSLWCAISADGRFVAFSSEANDLVPGDQNGKEDIFLHDLVTRRTTRVSVDSMGNEATGGSTWPAVSAEGRFVTFSSESPDLVPGDNNGLRDVFRHDAWTGETLRVSVGVHGTEANNQSHGGAMSPDGRFVAFESSASNLVPEDTDTTSDVFLRGPELVLEAEPELVTVGATATLTLWRGVPTGRASLYAVELDGVKVLQPLLHSRLDADGLLQLQGTVPPALAGHEARFLGIAEVVVEGVSLSNVERIVFQ